MFAAFLFKSLPGHIIFDIVITYSSVPVVMDFGQTK